MAIRLAQKGVSSASAPLGVGMMTLCQLFKDVVAKRPAKVALRVESPCPPYDAATKAAPASLPLESWKSWTFQQ